MIIGGKKGYINLIDFNTKQLLRNIPRGSSFNFGHTNRVFKVKFSTNENVFYSGGWDQTIFQWDV